MEIISISGLDGSGKSTQQERLAKHLEESGAKVHHFHSVRFSIANKSTSTFSAGEVSAVTHASWYKIQLRKIALLIDLVRFERLLTRLSSKGYTHILSDRYFYDTLINIRYLARKNPTSAFGINFLETLIRHPNNAFFLDTSPTTIKGRKRTIEQGITYLQEKKFLWFHYKESWHITTINGERPPHTITTNIIALLKNDHG